MKDSFHSSKKIPPALQKELMERKDNPGLIRFILMYILFVGLNVWVVISWGVWWQFGIAIAGLSVLCCSFFACEHETVHKTAFKTQMLNKVAARLCGIGHLYPSIAFQELHFTHHRHTHVPGKDPEITFGDRPMPSVVSNLPMYLSWLTGLPLLMFKVFMLFFSAIGMPEAVRKKVYPFIRPKVRGKLALESILILLIWMGLAALAIWVNPGFWGIFIPQVTGHCLLAGYTAAEHNGLPHEGDILNRTRSIRAGKLVKAVMWNMPYHAEHHAYPAIPFHALPKLHEAIKEELVHQELGHPAFHLKALSGEFSGQRKSG